MPLLPAILAPGGREDNHGKQDLTECGAGGYF
jgi:hypothetical protein